MRGTVLLVTRNHRESIDAVIAELAVAATELVADGVTLGLLLVDDRSTDGSLDIARRAAAQVGLAIDVVAADGTGAWATQRDGFAHSLATEAPDFLITHDPAGHHDARQLPDLIRSFRSKRSGITVGSRWARGGSAPGTPLLRALLSRLASRFVASATGLRRIRDVTTSFRVIRPDVARLVTARPVTIGEYGFFCEFAAVAQAYGFTVDEVPITFRPRFTAVPPLRLRDLLVFWSDVRRLRARIGTIRQEVATDQAVWAVRSGRMREQSPETGSEFGALGELALLSESPRFTSWIVDEIDVDLGHDVLEVGAGFGSNAVELASRRADRRVTAIEPAANVIDTLRERAAPHGNLDVHQITSGALLDRPHRFDGVVYINVLEHIADDTAELCTASNLLQPGGRLSIFVPAMPALYGSLDYKSGHYRRYTADRLRTVIEDAGFVDVDVHYVDTLGVLPYWLMYRVLDVARLDPVASKGYDGVVVPLSRAVQRIVPRPPIGKNLVATAQAPSDRSAQPLERLATTTSSASNTTS